MTEQAASASTGTPHAGSQPPPYTGSGFPLRHGLVRPRHGRYLAGVCAAIGRATNTDPVLWRVLLAVLGFFGGIGLLVYVAVWLATPAEGDSASPVEALLGRGRSGTSPIVVIILGMVVALMFGFIVTDGFRAALLGAAVLIGGALLLNRNTGGSGPAPPAGPGPGPGDAPTAPVPPRPADAPPAQPTPPAAAAEPGLVDETRVDDAVDDPTLSAASAPSASSTSSASSVPPQPVWPSPAGQAPPPPFPASRPFPPPPPPSPPGYRPPFAPYGPYGPGPGGVPPAPPAPPPPKPPRERSGLGAGTFSLIFVALGVVAALDLSGAVRVGPSAYFAAALITVALGLLVGAWFGRARWLIALGLALSAALGIATAAGAVNPDDGNFGADVTWRPATVDAIANRYENNFGNAVLDLSQVSFAGRDQRIAVEVNFGALEVIVPPTVDVTAAVQVSAGDATVFNDQWGGFDNTDNEVTDLGSDGRGGGQLRLDVQVNAGNVEVHR